MLAYRIALYFSEFPRSPMSYDKGPGSLQTYGDLVSGRFYNINTCKCSNRDIESWTNTCQ